MPVSLLGRNASTFVVTSYYVCSRLVAKNENLLIYILHILLWFYILQGSYYSLYCNTQ
jgi:hypothetical protein